MNLPKSELTNDKIDEILDILVLDCKAYIGHGNEFSLLNESTDTFKKALMKINDDSWKDGYQKGWQARQQTTSDQKTTQESLSSDFLDTSNADTTIITQKGLAHLIHQAEIKARIAMVNQLFDGWVDAETDEKWLYITKKHRDQIIKALEKEIKHE